MTWYEFWLFLHVTAVIVWAGGALIGQVFGVLTSRAADPARSVAYARDTIWIVYRVFVPAAVVVVVSGLGLTSEGAWDWGEPFIVFGLLVWAGAAVVFAFLPRALGRAVDQLVSGGPSPAVALRIRNLVWVSRVLVLFLFAVVFMMTVKPGT